MSQHVRDIHGHKVYGEDDAVHGLDYLSSALSMEEAKTFFDEAKSRGEADFQDSQRRNFTLVRGNDATYTVVARKESSGWF